MEQHLASLEGKKIKDSTAASRCFCSYPLQLKKKNVEANVKFIVLRLDYKNKVCVGSVEVKVAFLTIEEGVTCLAEYFRSAESEELQRSAVESLSQ